MSGGAFWEDAQRSRAEDLVEDADRARELHGGDPFYSDLHRRREVTAQAEDHGIHRGSIADGTG